MSGSNDGTTYSDIGGTFTLGGTTMQVHTSLIDNATAYRYYCLTAPTAIPAAAGLTLAVTSPVSVAAVPTARR